jgi:hypothetical protein
MSISELKDKATKILLEHVSSQPDKTYYGYPIWDNLSVEYFDKLDKGHRGWVYVIFDDAKERVKIGYTIRNPVERARRVFPSCKGTKLYIAAFPCKLNEAYKVEGYVHSILYSCGLQSSKRGIGNAEAYSGGTEIFDIMPRIACALIDETVNDWVIQ